MDEHTPLGLEALGSLRAEDEPWLARCYVPPRDFLPIASWRSALVYGRDGAGKTALRLALERYWCPPGQTPSVLLVRWPLDIGVAPGLEGTALVRAYAAQVMHVVAQALLQHLSRHPEGWGQTPQWARESLTWFVRQHLQADLAHYAASLEGEVSAEGLSLLHHLSTASVPAVLRPGVPTPLVIAELVRALQAGGLEGVRITLDGLEPWVEADPTYLSRSLNAFLSTLGQFEHPRFAYTMLLPHELRSPDWAPSALARRRVDEYYLHWDRETLCTLTERRLALALGKPAFRMEDLGPAGLLLNWLSRCGADVPRGWLSTVRPFLAAYLAGGEEKVTPLTERACRTVQERHPPQLIVDTDAEQVTVGWREVVDLTPGPWALLHHLYRHRGKVCPREALYRAYVEGTGGQVQEPIYPTEYAGTLDNAILRLRKAIEPDPEHPTLIVTIRGKGYKLVWTRP